MGFEIGSTIGDYQVVDVLGAGGMGQVYKVRNLISDRIEAMKVLLPNLDSDHELAERFMREIKVQASLEHPNIAALHTAQRVGNQLLMIMEFVDGHTIEFLMHRGRIPLRDSVNYASQVLAALAYAHARGVVHRDIKPANMMLTPKGAIKLMDFGIAKINDVKLTQTGKTVGSLFYMSPEQIRGDANIDARSDLYSLGISLYEMATGHRPFDGESDYSIMAAHLQQAPHPPVQIDPSLPQALSDIILMSLAKDPAQRFQTADAFRVALESAAKGLGAAPAAHAQGPAPTPRPRAKTQAEMLSMPLPAQSLQPPPPPPPQLQYPQYSGMAAAMPPPAAPPRSSNRGLYIVIGSLVTIGVLGATAFFAPKLWKTSATGKPAPQIAQSTTPPQGPAPQAVEPRAPQAVEPPPLKPQPPVETPTPSPVAQPPASPQPSNPPVVTTPAPPTERTSTVPLKTPIKTPSKQVETPVVQPLPATPIEPPPQKPIPQEHATPMPQPGKPSPSAASNELDELRNQRNLMLLRVQTVDESIKSLQEQNRASGLGVSSDLIKSQKRIGFFLEVTNTALQNGNVAEARTSLANAERELSKLEHHFGH